MVVQVGHQIQVSTSKAAGGGHDTIAFDNGNFGVFWQQSGSETNFRGRVIDPAGNYVGPERQYLWENDSDPINTTDYSLSRNYDGSGFIFTYTIHDAHVNVVTVYDQFQNPIGRFYIESGSENYLREYRHQSYKLTDGTYLIVTSREQSPVVNDGQLFEVIAQRFDAAFQSFGDPLKVYSDLLEPPANFDVTLLSEGAFEVAIGMPPSPEDSQVTLENGSVVRTWAQDGDIWAEVDGAGPFRVNEATSGNQTNPDVEALEGGRFVISWETISLIGGDSSLDVDAQIFIANEHILPTISLVNRPGLVDGSALTNEILAGTSARNTFFFNQVEITGADRITDFGANDVLALQGRLPDVHKDGIIGFGADGLVDLDGVNRPRDTVKIDGVDALRVLGEAGEGVFVYARADVRLTGAKESLLGDSALSGDAKDAKTDIFFFDLNLGLNLGNDTVSNFGKRDIFVTTAKLQDGNNDGVIQFGSNGLLDLHTTKGERLGQATLTDISAAPIKALEFDGKFSSEGVDYFVYSQIGSPSLYFGDFLA